VISNTVPLSFDPPKVVVPNRPTINGDLVGTTHLRPDRRMNPAGSAGRLFGEIKHDGFRILARRQAGRVRLVTRNGYDFTARYPKIVTAVESLPVTHP
jgi:hypothetical protein